MQLNDVPPGLRELNDVLNAFSGVAGESGDSTAEGASEAIATPDSLLSAAVKPAAAPFRLGDAMVAANQISSDQLECTLRQQRLLTMAGAHVLLGELLVRNRFTTAAAVDEVLRHSGGNEVRPEYAGDAVLLSAVTCLRYRVVPVRATADTLVVRTAQKLSHSDRQALIGACSVPVTGLRVMLTDRHEMLKLLSTKANTETFGPLLERLRSTEEMAPAHLKAAIDALLRESIDLRASDIHLDNKADPDAWISMRVDSRLRQLYLLPSRTMAPVFARLKTLCGMDASNVRISQDGRMSLEHKGRIVGFRVATQPLVDGETMTIRVIDAAALPTAEALFPAQPRMLRLLNRIARAEGKSGGLVLVTGPTGSGKSTTLYTIASMIPRDQVNVLTVEDPVEYVLPYARQIHLDHNKQSTSVERSVLRQDPDILMMGEIRDADTAAASLKFAESGHLVLATLHSKTASQAVERLLSMIPESDRHEAALALGQTLEAIINQRLVRRLCKVCAQEIPASEAEGAWWLYAMPESVERPEKLFRAVGCPHCFGSGYRDRVALHETLIFEGDDSARAQLSRSLVQTSGIADLGSSVITRISKGETAFALLGVGALDGPTVEAHMRGTTETSTTHAGEASTP